MSTPVPYQQTSKPELSQETLTHVSTMLGDEQLQSFLRFIGEKGEIKKILSEMKTKLSPEFSDRIKQQLSLDGESQEIDGLINSLMTLFSFVLYSSINKLQAKEILDEYIEVIILILVYKY